MIARESRIDTEGHDLFPILVGVTGKRRFDDKDAAADSRLRSAFQTRFRALVEEFDRLFPDTPKALVCGAAAGADLAAASVVLDEHDGKPRHPNWAVVLMLPFEQKLFEEDFDGPSLEDELAQLRKLCAGHPRVVVKTMRRLRIVSVGGGPRNCDETARVDDATLSRDSPTYYRIERQRHYEQLGLWLARYCTILIATGASGTAMPPSTGSPRLGGTARVVAYRRAAMPDEAAAHVIDRSCELIPSSPLEEPDGGYVFWLDPAEDFARAHVLRPIQRVANVREAKTSFLARRRNIYDSPFLDPWSKDEIVDPSRVDARRRGAFALAGAFEDFHRRRRAARGPHAGPAAPRFGAQHPAAYLEGVRNGALGKQQTDSAEMNRVAQRYCAFLFVFAVAAYETYIELLPDEARVASWIVLLLYLFLLGVIWFIAHQVHEHRIQLRAEDYRGVREMMRVQIAWWSTGVDRMVDRIHLRGIDTNLRLAREAMAAIGIWALLRCTDMPNCEIPPRMERAPRDYAADWMKNQSDFFHKNAEAQFGAKRLAEIAVAVTFRAAMSALIVLAILRAPFFPCLLRIVLRAAKYPAVVALPPLAVMVAAGVLWTVTKSAVGANSRQKAWADAALKARRTRAAAQSISGRLRWGVLSPILRLWHLPPWVVFALGALALLPWVSQIGIPLRLPSRLSGLPYWVGPASFLALLALFTIIRLPDDAKSMRVQEFDVGRKRGAALLLTLLLLSAAIVFAPALADLRAGEADGFENVFRELSLAQSVLLLAGAGMIRWYTERRNHLAQAAHYDDMLRAFRRAEDWLNSVWGPLDAAARQRLIELGELALDENEAWLKAHRDRPTEAIAPGG